MNVDDIVRIRIAEAARRVELAKKRRAAQQAARDKGLAQRHAAKLRNLAARRPEPAGVARPDPKEIDVPERALTTGPVTAATDDIRDHGYAVLQTRIERVPGTAGLQCAEPDGCPRPASLMTLAIAEVEFEGAAAVGFRLARDETEEIVGMPTCDEHRCEASHILFYRLTGQARPEGIRAYDLLGQHMDWLAGGQS